MEYANAYPCFYGLLGGGATKVNGNYEETIKNGSSWHIGNRKSGALTYFVDVPVFQFVIVIPQDYFHSKDELYVLDAEFVEFIKQKGLGQYYINKGGGTEWFLQSCPTSYLELRKEFLAQKGIPILAIIENDPFPIYDLNMEQKKADEEEQNRIARAKEISWISMFMRIFFPDGELRSNQWELWQNFLKIAESSSYYAGIVQWPTGTGKTIGMIILLFLSFMSYKKQGKIFRGLLITHKNDILDTLMKKIKLLEKFGITVLDGSNAKFSSLVIPKDKNILVIATHASLTEEAQMDKLPDITHFHYDEVHRITGSKFFELIKKFKNDWKTQFLTGTSATPLTSSIEQRNRLAELFGEPTILLHQVTVEDAVAKGWIAQPRFHTNVVNKGLSEDDLVTQFVHLIGISIIEKKNSGKWQDGKILAFLPNRSLVRKAFEIAKKKLTHCDLFTAVENGENDESWHPKFITAMVNNRPKILFACQRYREGSDIANLEMTCVLMGEEMAAYILLQIIGRALRADYAGKEGWCIILRPSEEHITPEQVFENIMLNIIDSLGKNENSISRETVKKLVEAFIGKVNIKGKCLDIEETVDRVQAMSVRRQYQQGIPFHKLQDICQEKQILTRKAYEQIMLPLCYPELSFVCKNTDKSPWFLFNKLRGNERYSLNELAKRIKEANIRKLDEYKEKYLVTKLPSWDEILEGFCSDTFGEKLSSAYEAVLFPSRGRR